MFILFVLLIVMMFITVNICVIGIAIEKYKMLVNPIMIKGDIEEVYFNELNQEKTHHIF